MSTLAGTGKLIRLILRRERLRLSIWVVVLAGVPMITANAFIDLYPDDASREALAATVISSPALTSMLGPLYDSSLGGLVAWRAGVLGAIFVALMAVLTVIRHTREEEETGRRELLGATVVGRHAQLAAALMVTIGAGVLVALLLTAGLTGVGLPFAARLPSVSGSPGSPPSSPALGQSPLNSPRPLRRHGGSPCRSWGWHICSASPATRAETPWSGCPGFRRSGGSAGSGRMRGRFGGSWHSGSL